MSGIQDSTIDEVRAVLDSPHHLPSDRAHRLARVALALAVERDAVVADFVDACAILKATDEDPEGTLISAATRMRGAHDDAIALVNRLQNDCDAWIDRSNRMEKALEEAKEARDELVENAGVDVCALFEQRDEMMRQRDRATDRAKAAEAERDAVTVERDEAYRQRDEATGKILQADMDRAHVEKLWDKLGDVLEQGDESMIQAVERIMAALAEARRERDNARIGLQTYDALTSDCRAILGAAPDELLSDAAERTIRQRDAARDNLALIRDTLNPPAGVSVLDAADWYRREVEALRERVCAEAEPPQVFRPPISVTVHHVTGHAFAEVEVGDVTDPAFLALPMGVRLGLVVLRA